MKYKKNINIKKYRPWIAVFVMLLCVVVFLRSPYLSNKLKMELLSGLQKATGKQIITSKIYINIVPFFVGFNDLRVFNQDGSKVAETQQVKAYLDPFKLFIRTIDIERIVIVDADILISKQELADLRARVADSGMNGGGLFKVKLAKIVLQGSDIEYVDPEGVELSSYGTAAELTLNKKALGLEFDSKTVKVSGLRDSHKIPDMDFSLSFIARKSGRQIELDKLEYERRGTLIAGQGLIVPAESEGWEKLELRLDASLAIESLSDLFDLKADTKGTVNAKGTVNYDPSSDDYLVDFGVKGDMNLESLLELLKAQPNEYYLTGHMEFDGRLKGPLSDLTGMADASITNSDLYGVHLARGRCRVDYADHLLKFSGGKADIYNGSADVFVSVSLPGGAPFAVDISFNNADSGPLFELIGIGGFGLSPGKVDGTFYTAGMEFSPKGKAVYVSSGSGELPTARIQRISGQYHTDEEQVLHLEGFKAATALSSIEFNGRFGLSTHEILIDGTLDSADISDLFPASFPEMNGQVKFAGRVTGNTADPRLVGSASFTGVEVEKYSMGQGEIELDYSKGRLDVLEANASLGSSSHLIAGHIEFPVARYLFDMSSPRFAISAAAISADLGGALNALSGRQLDIAGKYDAYITLEGSQEKPLLRADAFVYDAKAFGRRIDKAEMSISYKDGWIDLAGINIVSGVSSLSGEFRAYKDGRYAFKAHSDKAMMSLALRDIVPLEYAMKLDADGEGTFSEPEIRLSAKLSAGSYKMRPVGGGDLSLTLSGDELRAKAALVDGKVSVVGGALLSANYPWDMDVRLQFDRYEYLFKQFLTNAPSDLTVGAEGALHVWGDRQGYSLTADLKRLNLFLFEQGYSNIDDVKFSVSNSVLEINKLSMQSGTASMHARGTVGLDGAMNLQFSGGSSLSPLRLFSDKVDVAKGEAEFDLAITGTIEVPEIEGSLKVLDATIAFPGMVQKLSSINGTLVFGDGRATLESVRASIGGGTIDALGTLDYDGLQVKTINIETNIKDVSAYLTKGFVASISGNVMLAGTAERQELVGELRLNKAFYDKRIDWKSWLLSGAKALQPSEKASWMERVNLNVGLFGERGIKVDNNLARADLSLDIFARGTLAEPILYGKIESVEGKVYFRNSEFDIIKATADYSDIDISGPYVDIQAKTTVKNYRIWLSLEGRADQMDLTLTSDPPLDDVDILALLTLGDYGENLSGLESGISAAEATSFLTGKIQDVVEERFTIITGFDRFQIDPYVSRTTSTVTPRVTLSKRLAGESVFVTYSSTLDAVAEQEFKLEYLLNENVSLLAGQDYTGSMGSDVKIRFSFK